MDSKEYQKLAMRTNDGKCSERLESAVNPFVFWSATHDYEDVVKIVGYDPGGLLNGALGLTGEAGEVSDMIKKHIFHGHDLDTDALIKELGDCAWYIALICTAIGVGMDTVLECNIEKLKKRYPEGFSSQASIERVE